MTGLRRHSILVLVALTIAAALIPAVPSLAAAELSMTKSGPGQVLSGEPITFTITASNPGDAPEFNLTVRDTLPPGVSYAAGSTSPALAGDPQVITNSVETPPDSGEFVDQQTLVWSNLTDLEPGDSRDLSFQVTYNQEEDPGQPALPAYVVGSTITNTAQTFASPDARVVPAFDQDGVPIPDPAVDSATDSATTTLSAITVTKSEPSPEAELLRGLHDGFPTTYTLTIEVTDQADVDDVVVSDHLAASLEFLGCGGIDNSQAGTEEYPGSGRLDGTAAVADCTFPDTVETVVDPPPQGTTTYPAGVWTRLEWSLGDLAAGDVVTLPYAAGIGLQANEPFPDPAPDPASGLQAANLDNNTGASTRELADEASVANIVHVTGGFTGEVEPGTPAQMEAQDSLNRDVEDLRIRKAVSPADFNVGEVATYTVTIDISEYVADDGLVLSDTLPNGVCPLDDQANNAVDGGGDCDPATEFAPTVTVGATTTPLPYETVTPVPAGGYDVVFSTPATLGDGETAVVTYQARMRAAYEGALDGEPPAAGDTFTNTVSAQGTTIPIPGVPGGGQAVTDDSQATQGTDLVTVDKEVLPRTALDPDAPCPADAAAYVEPAEVDAADISYRLGDRVCFLLRVDFSAQAFTRNVTVVDALPPGVAYAADTMQATAADTASSTFNEAEAVDGADPTWLIGDDGVGGRFVAPGQVFEVVVGGEVVSPAAAGSPLLTDNLLKMRAENTDGSARIFRDALPFTLLTSAAASVAKGVAAVDQPAFTTDQPDQDDVEVQEGSLVTYRLDITNDGTGEAGNDFGIGGLDTWDVLPDGITCAQVSAITNFVDDGGSGPVYAACTNPGDAGHPTFTERGTRSAIRWQFPPVDPDGGTARWAIQPGETRTLTYQVEIPTPTSAGVRLTNDAAIRSFVATTNLTDGSATYYPADNVDDSVTTDQENAPAAADPSAVFTPGALVTKSGTTSITESNNDTPRQAVAGELVTYTYSVDIPPATSVFEATLADPVFPAQLTLVDPPPVGRLYPDADDPGPSVDLPPGFTLDAAGTLTFPQTWTNDTATTQRFEVEVVARVGNGFGDEPTLANTATFTSFDEVGGAPVTTAPASYEVRVVQPSPRVSKTASSEFVIGDQEVTFRLAATNPAGRPPLHDTWLVDCIPAGLTFASFGLDSGVTLGPEAGGAGNDCAAGTTFIAFALDTLPGNGTAVGRTYDATVEPAAVGGTRYTNTVTLTGSSLDDGTADGSDDSPDDTGDPFERTYLASAQETVVVRGAEALKQVDPPQATIGEQVTYTVSTAFPPDVNLYQAALLDTVPVGLDATSLVLVSTECFTVPEDPAGCSYDGELLPPVLLPDGSRVAAVSYGDITAEPFTRVLVATYTANVADIDSNVAGATIDNDAQAVWDDVDGDPPPDGSYEWTQGGEVTSAELTVLEPDVSITKAVSNPTPEPGELFTYSIAFTNADGPFVSDAFDGVITDLVPLGVTVLPLSISRGGSWDPTTRTITWTAADLPGPLPPGGTQTLTYTARLAPSPGLTTDPLTNTATGESYESLPQGGRVYTGDDADATVTPAFPALTTTKEVLDPAPASIGEAVTWQVTVTNDGDGTAFGVTVEDTLPTNWSYVAGSTTVTFPDTSTATPEPVLAPLVDPTTATWTGLGRLEPGQALTLSLDLVPDPDVVDDPGIGSVVDQVNTAESLAYDRTSATGNAEGPYGGDADTAVTRIDAVDLLLDKSHDPDSPPVAGEDFSWTVDVSNQSTTDTAVGPFVVTDTLPADPAGIDWVSATGDGWSCTEADGEVTCQRVDTDETLGPEASFPSLTVTVSVPTDVPEGTELTNAATVTEGTYELAPADNTDDDTAQVVALADLQVVKGRTADLEAGTPATYTLDVTNLGPSVSVAPITVTDTLPDDMTFVEATAGTGWEPCTEDAGVVTCVSTQDLAVGASAPQVAITVDVASSATGELTNTAEVDPTTTDPDLDNNVDEDTGTVGVEADLRIDKRSTTEIVAGDNATYRLRVDNGGPSDAAEVVQITDTLPAGLTWVDATSIVGTWTCTSPDDVSFTCDLDGALAVGDFATVDIEVDVDPSVSGEVVNTATVTSPTPDPVPSNNTDSDDSQFDTFADLVIDKTPDAGPATAGEPVTWTLAVANDGPSDAQPDIVVTDALPDGATFVSADGIDWACAQDAGVVTCTHDQVVPPGGSAPDITLVTDLAPDVGPALVVNPSSVTGTTNDPDLANNADNGSVLVTDLAEVGITKDTTGDDPVFSGLTTEFTLTVVNDGPSTADQVTVTDRLPIGLGSIEAVGDGWDCGASTRRTVVCSRGALDPGTAPPIVVTVEVSAAVPDGTTITNTASVDTSTTQLPTDDPDSLPDSDTSDVTVLASADLTITKTHDPDTVRIGEDVDFTLLVDNLGPSGARDLVVTDTLPAGLVPQAASGSGWSCDVSDQDVTCTRLVLRPSTTAPPVTLTALVTPQAFASVDNVATVAATTPDPDLANNTATDTVIVPELVDLTISKTHTEPVEVGATTTWTLVVGNDGPIDDPAAITVVDEVPTGLVPTAASSVDADCTVAGQLVTCVRADGLAVGDSFSIDITTDVDAAAYPRVVNPAIVSSPTDDRNRLNNAALDTATVPPLVDLSITKGHDDPVAVGDTMAWAMLVSNAGPTADPGPVTVTDVLPDGLVPVSATGEGMDCTITGQQVACIVVDGLAVDEARTLQVLAQVGPAAAPSATNTVSVDTPSPEVDLVNNVATDVVAVTPTVALAVDKSVADQQDDLVTWALAVTNLGPSDTVAPVVVADDLPAGLVYVSGGGQGWACTGSATSFTCTHDASVAAGTQAPPVDLVTRVEAAPGTEITNVVVASGGGPDVVEVTGQAVVTAPDDPDDADLPGTGLSVLPMLAWALLLAALGAGLLGVGRHRSRRR